jgi:hypothetical protein
MKITAEILSVDSNGDSLSVKVQGKEARAAEWRPYLAFTLQIPDNVKNRKAFHLGRKVRVTVETV